MSDLSGMAGRGPSQPRWLRWLPAGYLVLGLAWILGSDRALGWLFGDDPATLLFAGSLKGVLFVLVTAILIYIVVVLRTEPAPASPDAATAVRGRTWQPVAAFLLAGLVITVAGYAIYARQAAAVKQSVARELTARAELKAQQIGLWFADQSRPLFEVARGPFTTEAVTQWRATGREDLEVRLQQRLQVLLAANRYAGVWLFDASGQQLLGVGAPVSANPRLLAAMARAIDSGEVDHTDIYQRPAADGRGQALDFVARLGRRAPAPVVLVARVHPEEFLQPVLEERSASLATAETLLVRREDDRLAYLGRLKYGSGEPLGAGLPLSATEVAAVRIVLGERGVMDAQDYRGEPVLAAGHAVEGTPWFLVSKADLKEIRRPLLRLFAMAASLAGAAILAAAGLVMLWWRGERLRASLQLAGAEARAAALEQRFGAVNRQASDVLLLLDERGRILDANQRAEQLYGYTRDELLGLTIYDLRGHDPPERDRVQRQIEALRDRGHLLFEAVHRRKDGSTVPVEVNAGRVDLGGESFVQSVVRDVSERKRDEARIAELAAERDRTLAQLQLQFERMPIGCVVSGPGLAGLQVNPAFERLFGYSRAELEAGDAYGLIVPPELRDDLMKQLAALQHRDETLVLVHENLTRAGTRIICRWTNTPLKDGQGRLIGVMAMCENITEQVMAERALRASEDRLRVLADAAPVGIIRTDLEARISYVNARYSEITGRSGEAALGDAWQAAVLAEDRERVHAAIREAIQTGVYRSEHRIRRPDGQVLWVLGQALAEYGADGSRTGFVGTVTDITDLKRTQADLEAARAGLEARVAERTHELMKAKERAEHADKIKTSFLSMMSHELRTPLNSILGFTDVILQGYSGPLTPDQQHQLGIVRDSSLHLLELINDVLDISRIEAGQLRLEIGPVDLPDLLRRRVLAFEAQAAAKGLGLECRIGADVGGIRSDAKRVSQIIANLVANAVKFTERGGVAVEARAADGTVVIEVSDTGPGIAADQLPRLFTAFEQLEASGRSKEGTGLGLAISRHLARALGGDIHVRSEPGRGSCFTVVLPFAAPGDATLSETGIFRRPPAAGSPGT